MCLLYVLMRIPFWITRPVLSPFGRSPLRRAVRFAFTAAVLSRVAPAAARRRGRQRQGRSVRERKERKRPVSYEVSDPVPIPADIEMPDKILAGLTARQVAIAAVAAVIIWAGVRGHPPRHAAAGVRGAGRPGRGGRDRPGDRRAGRADPGPAAGRRVAPGPLPAPPGHRPRGHPRRAGLGRAARPAAPRRCRRRWRRCGGTSPRRGDRPGRRRRRGRGGGVDGELRAAQPRPSRTP